MNLETNLWEQQDNLDGLELLFSKNFMEENKQKEQQQQRQTAVTNPPSQVLVIQPQYSGEIQISVNTQIQTNRRTNFYLVADWPAQLLQKKMPIFYYPPINETIYEQCSKINTPTSLWLSEMGHFYYGTSSYLEVQFWMNNQEGMKQLIPKCRTHSTLIKLPGQPYEEKAISHEEVKWKRNTMVFGVNFNCTRSCFKSEVYMFVRARLGHLFWESSLIELPFRRSEKRKQDQVGLNSFSSTSKKHLLQAPEFSAPIISQPSENSLLNQMLQKSSIEEQIDLQRRILAHLQRIEASSQRAPEKSQQNNATIQEVWSPSHSQSNIFTNSTFCNPTEIQWFPEILNTEDIM